MKIKFYRWVCREISLWYLKQYLSSDYVVMKNFCVFSFASFNIVFLSGSGARRLYRKWAWVWHVASGRCHKFTNNWLHGFRSRLMNGLLVFGHVFFVCFPFPVTCTQQLTSWLPDTSSPTADRMASGHKFINSWLHGFRSRALNGWLAFGHVLSFLFSISGWLVLFSIWLIYSHAFTTCMVPGNLH